MHAALKWIRPSAGLQSLFQSITACFVRFIKRAALLM